MTACVEFHTITETAFNKQHNGLKAQRLKGLSEGIIIKA